MSAGNPKHIISKGQHRNDAEDQEQRRKQQMKLTLTKLTNYQIQHRGYQHNDKICGEEPVPAPQNGQEHGDQLFKRSGFRNQNKETAGYCHRPEDGSQPKLCESGKTERLFTEQITGGDTVNIHGAVAEDLQKAEKIKLSRALRCICNQTTLSQNMMSDHKKHGYGTQNIQTYLSVFHNR